MTQFENGDLNQEYRFWTSSRKPLSVCPEPKVKVLPMNQRVNHLRIMVGLFTLWWIVLVFFHDFPGVDIALQSAFFSAQKCLSEAADGAVCGVFPVSQKSSLVDLRWFFYWLPPAIVILLIGYVVVHWKDTLNETVKENVHQVVIVILSWIVSVGFIVNFLLKSYSGRPRPVNTDLFGGGERFIPAGGFGGTCESNCSFISGEAASAGWLICLLPLLPPSLRPTLGSGLVIISIATPLLRIAFGGHYPSDALLGWLITPLTFMVLVCLFGWKTGQKTH